MSIIDCAIGDNLPMIKLLVQPSDINKMQTFWKTMDGKEYKKGVLHWAVVRNNIEMISFWISFENCNVNLQTTLTEETALHFCVDPNYIGRHVFGETRMAIITLLMKAGADVTLRNYSGNTPLSGLSDNGWDLRFKNHIKALMFEPYEFTMLFLCCLNDARTEMEEYEDMIMLGYEYERRETFALTGFLNVDNVDMMCYHILKYIL